MSTVTTSESGQGAGPDATAPPVPAAGTWTADPVHSDISFRVRHMGIGKVRGRFALESATLSVGAGGLTHSSVTATVDAASVDTGEPPRDAHVRSDDFLDVQAHPTIRFVSTKVGPPTAGRFTVAGDLTLHGVTRAVELAVEHLGIVDDPSGVQRTGFVARTSISRAAFGIDIQLAFGAGNAVVGDRIDIDLDIEFVSEGNG